MLTATVVRVRELIGAAALAAVISLTPFASLTGPAAAQGLFGPPDAEKFQEGVAAYDRGDYTAAYEIWVELAEDGDLAAQRNVGHLLRKGLGVARDAEAAADYYREAAERGLVPAQVNLGSMLLAGDGIEKDEVAAAYWFQNAALAGHPIAQYNLGLMYESGQGIDRDIPRAMGWYHIAARNGHDKAIERLANLVLATPDSRLADTSLMRSSAAPGAGRTTVDVTTVDTEAELEGVETAPRRDEEDIPVAALGDDLPEAVRESASPRAIVEDYAASTTAAVSPEIGAQFMKAQYAYEQGDYLAAARGWLALAEQGVAEAQYRLGRLYYVGIGVAYDPQEAYKWWYLAERGGDMTAAYALRPLRKNLTQAQIDEAVARAEKIGVN